MALASLRMEADKALNSVEYSASAKFKVLISQEAVIGDFSSLSLHPKPPFLRREQIHDNTREMNAFPAEAALMLHMDSRNIFKLDVHGCIHGKHTEYRPSRGYNQWSSIHTLHAVAEDRPLEETVASMLDDIENDSLSSSASFSSLTENSSSSSSSSSLSSENSQNSADIEAAMETQSFCKGESDGFYTGSPPSTRRGLSKFYGGKSKSFSCVRDVVSVKELAKPENPYARRFKQNKYHNLDVNRQRILPAQKGSALISKKSVQSGKTTLALAMAMSFKTTDYQSLSVGDDLHSPLPSRSFSLSDLHVRGEPYF